MRLERILGAIGLCLCLSGCRLASDATHNMIFETCLFANDVKGKIYYPLLARSAWDNYCTRNPDKARSGDFACGFKEGYADYLENGGDCSSPALPPIRYWKIHHETPKGRAATELWMSGFREGAAAAQASGKRELVVVPVGGAPAAPEALPAPPNGPPPGPPLPAVLPPTVPDDQLPPPRSLPYTPTTFKKWPARPEQTTTVPVSPPSVPSNPSMPAAANAPCSSSSWRRTEDQGPDMPPPEVRRRQEGPEMRLADYQVPVVQGQSGKAGGASKEEIVLPRIVNGGKPAAAPAAPEVPLPPRDKTPRSADAQYQVGMVLLQAGNAKSALTWLYSALREDPNHVPTHKALMEYYQKTGDYFRAAEHRVKANPPSEDKAAERE